MRSDPTLFPLSAPGSLADVLRTLAAEPGRHGLLAGGTELMVAFGSGRLPTRPLLSIQHLAELRFIRVDHDAIHIGSGTTFTDIRRHAALSAAVSVTRAIGIVDWFAGQPEPRHARWQHLQRLARRRLTPRPARLRRHPHPGKLNRRTHRPLRRVSSRLQANRAHTHRAPAHHHDPPPLRWLSPLHPQGRHPQRAGYLKGRTRCPGQSRGRHPRRHPHRRRRTRRPSAPLLRHGSRSCRARHRRCRHPPSTRRARPGNPPHRRHPLHRPLSCRGRRQSARRVSSLALANLYSDRNSPRPATDRSDATDRSPST